MALDISSRRQIWEFKSASVFLFTPVVVDGIVLFSDLESVYALGSSPANMNIVATPTLALSGSQGSPQLDLFDVQGCSVTRGDDCYGPGLLHVNGPL